MKQEIAIHNPITHQQIKKVSLQPINNLTDYDDEPFFLEKAVRQFLRQRYQLDVIPHQGDMPFIHITFLNFSRGRLRLANDDDVGTTLTVQAQLELFDAQGKSLTFSNISESETLENLTPQNFERARLTLLNRLAERLVVDLLEH